MDRQHNFRPQHPPLPAKQLPRAFSFTFETRNRFIRFEPHHHSSLPRKLLLPILPIKQLIFALSAASTFFFHDALVEKINNTANKALNIDERSTGSYLQEYDALPKHVVCHELWFPWWVTLIITWNCVCLSCLNIPYHALLENHEIWVIKSQFTDVNLIRKNMPHAPPPKKHIYNKNR